MASLSLVRPHETRTTADRYFEDLTLTTPRFDLKSDPPSSQFIALLPAPVRQRVEALRTLQAQQDQVAARFRKAVRDLEEKFLKEAYQPLFDRRFAIVNGVVSHSGAYDPHSSAGHGAGGPAGIPDFWLGALRRHRGVALTITPRDEDALRHLVDVCLDYVAEEGGGREGFQLSFHFGPNPYFTNDVLRKTFFYRADKRTGVREPECVRVDRICWMPGHDFSMALERRQRRDKRTKQTRVTQAPVPSDTFFNFFKPSQGAAGSEDADDEEARRWALALEFETGEQFRNQIIPEAVKWYTGEAAEDTWVALTEDESCDEEDDDDEDHFGDDDDDEDEFETDEDSEQFL
ncbi:nucleosome assembly protein [Nemania diffusa]|nr:nucleosome assembly protein [Nemania diffusa]